MGGMWAAYTKAIAKLNAAKQEHQELVVGAKKTAALQGEDELAPLLLQISIYTQETIVP